jgi:hypothetical protein
MQYNMGVMEKLKEARNKNSDTFDPKDSTYSSPKFEGRSNN